MMSTLYCHNKHRKIAISKERRERKKEIIKNRSNNSTRIDSSINGRSENKDNEAALVAESCSKRHGERGKSVLREAESSRLENQIGQRSRRCFPQRGHSFDSGLSIFDELQRDPH